MLENVSAWPAPSEIIERHQAGETWDQIAASLGTTRNYVRRYLGEFNDFIHSRANGARYRRGLPPVKDLLARKNAGETWKAISMSFGVHTETIRRYIKDQERHDCKINKIANQLAVTRNYMRDYLSGDDVDPRPALRAADLAFCELMKDAIALKRERAKIGINTEASTTVLRLSLPGMMGSGCGSPSAHCVEVSDE